MIEAPVTRAEHEALRERVESLEESRAFGVAVRGGILNTIKTFGPVIVAALAILMNRLAAAPPG